MRILLALLFSSSFSWAQLDLSAQYTSRKTQASSSNKPSNKPSPEKIKPLNESLKNFVNEFAKEVHGQDAQVIFELPEDFSWQIGRVYRNYKTNQSLGFDVLTPVHGHGGGKMRTSYSIQPIAKIHSGFYGSNIRYSCGESNISLVSTGFESSHSPGPVTAVK